MSRDISYQINRQWNNDAADWEYLLQYYVREGSEIEFELIETWKGDKPWAKRQATHYNIPFPELEKRS